MRRQTIKNSIVFGMISFLKESLDLKPKMEKRRKDLRDKKKVIHT